MVILVIKYAVTVSSSLVLHVAADTKIISFGKVVLLRLFGSIHRQLIYLQCEVQIEFEMLLALCILFKNLSSLEVRRLDQVNLMSLNDLDLNTQCF